MKYEIRVNGQHFLSGDEISIKVIYNNLIGRNMKGNKFENYIEAMNKLENKQLKNLPIALFEGKNKIRENTVGGELDADF